MLSIRFGSCGFEVDAKVEWLNTGTCATTTSDEI